jgi:hypothetical protein
MPGWGRDTAQIDSGATDAAGRKDVAGALGMKGTLVSKKGVGYFAANVEQRRELRRKEGDGAHRDRRGSQH